MITFEREVTYEDAPTSDEYVDMTVRGGEVTYGRSPRVGGQYRVERVIAVVGGRRFMFGLRCNCRTQADRTESALRAADLSALTTLADPSILGFVEVR